MNELIPPLVAAITDVDYIPAKSAAAYHLVKRLSLLRLLFSLYEEINLAVVHEIIQGVEMNGIVSFFLLVDISLLIGSVEGDIKI